jgi:hypothetical protein
VQLTENSQHSRGAISPSTLACGALPNDCEQAAPSALGAFAQNGDGHELSATRGSRGRGFSSQGETLHDGQTQIPGRVQSSAHATSRGLSTLHSPSCPGESHVGMRREAMPAGHTVGGYKVDSSLWMEVH